MADKPSVLFISTCDESPAEIIKLVQKDDDSTDPIRITEDIDAYPYHIDNKYYTTDVNLCSLRRKTIGDESFASTVQGTVIYFDSSDPDSLKKIDSWMPFLKEYSSEMNMLVCKVCPEESSRGCSKRSVQEWCLGKEFELIELEPDMDEVDPDDDFPETTGVSRIIQVLNAHVWPNLVLKNSKTGKSQTEPGIDTKLSELASQLRLEESLEEILENDDFSHLFSQLPELKARVSALGDYERMDAALQIVEAFWNAMDGDGDGEDILDL